MPSDDLLTRYADVALRVGIGLRGGDRLLIHSPIVAADFTRIVVERAFDAGALNVDVMWSDEAVTRARFERGSSDASGVVSSASLGRLAAFEAGDLMMYVRADDPEGMAGLDPARLTTFQRANQAALEPLIRAQGAAARAWTIVAVPSPPWAMSVFPALTADEAVEALWSAIFRACRVDRDDPVAAWRAHIDELHARSAYLTSRGYDALHYEGPGTALTVGIPDGARWVGGSAGGFVPNLPTEEVFTAPHRLIGEGVVTATKPVSVHGNLIEDFAFEVSEGRIVSATAGRGLEVLDELIATDEGSIRFGEVAMVPMSSAVAAEALVWNNTLYDENDGCHIAIGRAYPISIEGGTELSTEELEAAGLNQSVTHVDFVVGSPHLDVHGVRTDGAEEPIISSGEWGFTV